MNTHNQRKSAGLFALALVLAFLAPSAASAQDTAAAHQNQAQASIPPAAVNEGEESQARRIAHERYQFLKSLELAYGEYLLYQTAETYTTILFPVKKSNIAYLVELGYQADGYQHNRVFCYQWKNNKTKLIYRVNFEGIGNPLKTIPHSKSLLDRLNCNGYVIKGRASKYAKSDLAAERDYAQYTYIPYTDTLVVWLSSQSDSKDCLYFGYNNIECYSVDEKDFSKKELNENKFYQKHGLPTATGEFGIIGHN